MFQKRIPIWAIVLTVIMITTFATGAVMLNRQVLITMKIEGAWSMKVLDEDAIKELTAIDFGTIYRRTTYRYPAAGAYYVKNIGDYEFYVSWVKANWPADVTLTVWVRQNAADSFEILPEGTVYSKILKTLGPTVNSIQWYITVDVTDKAPLQSFSPVLTWNAHDKASG